MALLDRQQILEALRALDHELGRLGVRGEVFVVGGAAMALAYDARRSTVDIDAIFAPPAEVRSAAEKVAEQMGLESSWLNDAVKAFIPGGDPDRIGVYEGRNLSVAAASPRFLLSMKLLAARVERDADDIKTLYEMCGFTSAEDGMDLVERSYPTALIPARTQFLLQELFPSRQEERNRGREGPELGF